MLIVIHASGCDDIANKWGENKIMYGIVWGKGVEVVNKDLEMIEKGWKWVWKIWQERKEIADTKKWNGQNWIWKDKSG